jgi:amino acid transporter
MDDIKRAGEDFSSNEKVPTYDVAESDTGGVVIVDNVDDLQRKLSGRQIQMITIGGSIGTALFVSIGGGLVQGGPGSLLISFILYCVWLAAVNNCMAEMAIFMPVSGSFIRMGSKWIDESFGFILGWNFFLYGKFDSTSESQRGLS